MKNVKDSVKSKFNIRWTLVFYDVITYTIVYFLLLLVYEGNVPFARKEILVNFLLALGSILICRFAGDVYRQIWRFGGIQCYIRFMITDAFAFGIFVGLEFLLQYLFYF